VKWGALALALTVLACTAAALVLTMRNNTGTKPAKLVPSPLSSVLDPLKRTVGAKPGCRDDAEGHDKSGEDRSSGRCGDEAGDEKDPGDGDNELDEKDSGD
jgi:hypothetical protein